MKEYQVSVSLPEEFESFEQLEMVIQQQGQFVKQNLLQQVIAEIAETQKAEKDPPICPDCQKKTRFVAEVKSEN
jgi:hypothetical protein